MQIGNKDVKPQDACSQHSVSDFDTLEKNILKIQNHSLMDVAVASAF